MSTLWNCKLLNVLFSETTFMDIFSNIVELRWRRSHFVPRNQYFFHQWSFQMLRSVWFLHIWYLFYYLTSLKTWHEYENSRCIAGATLWLSGLARLIEFIICTCKLCLTAINDPLFSAVDKYKFAFRSHKKIIKVISGWN